MKFTTKDTRNEVTIASIGGYYLDCVLTEDHGFESEVTEYPVENGTAVTDHVRVKPMTLSLEFIVSDTPIGMVDVFRSGAQALENSGLVETVTPSDEVIAFLLTLQNKREPTTVVTSIRTYENMVLESLSLPRDADTGYAVRGTAKFKQVIIVRNKRVSVPTAEPRGGKKVNQGAKTVKVFDLDPAWSCPAGVAVSQNTLTNISNRCFRVMENRPLARYEHIDGKPLTPAEVDQMNASFAKEAQARRSNAKAIFQRQNASSTTSHAFTRDPFILRDLPALGPA